MRKTWVQHPVTHKLIPKEEYVRPQLFHAIHKDIEPFISPVDGSVLSSRSQVRDHTKRYGVVSEAEFAGEGKQARKEREAYYSGQPHDTERRKDALKNAMDWHKEGRSQAEIRQMSENYRKLNR